jgi:hypothetical protein
LTPGKFRRIIRAFIKSGFIMLYSDAVAYFKPRAVWAMRLLMADFPQWGVDDAAAVLGNAGHESGGLMSLQEKNPTVPGSRGGYGWFQWTGSRRVSYEKYCERNGFDPADDLSNYKFLFLELKGSESRAIGEVAKAKTLEAKTRAFEASFERAGIKHYDSRIKWAHIARAAWDELGAQNQITTTASNVPETSGDIFTAVDRLAEMPQAEFDKFTLALAHAIVRRSTQSSMEKENENMFTGTKSIFASKTFWGLAVAALSTWSPLAGSVAGVILPSDVSAVDPAIVTDLRQVIEQVTTTLGLVFALFGRMTAKTSVTTTGKL